MTDPKQIVLRPQQTFPSRAQFYILAGGFGSGKTQAGSSWVLDEPEDTLIITTTHYNQRHTITEGESGLHATARREGKSVYKTKMDTAYGPTPYQVTDSNANIFVASLDRLIPGIGNITEFPEINITRVWVDEAQNMTLEQWELLREAFPAADYLITFTPSTEKNDFLTYLYNRAGAIRNRYILTTMSTYENIGNLSPRYVESVLARHLDADTASAYIYGHYAREHYA